MLPFADVALGQTLALLITFLGVGVVANVLVVYAVLQVMVERRQNRERRGTEDSF